MATLSFKPSFPVIEKISPPTLNEPEDSRRPMRRLKHVTFVTTYTLLFEYITQVQKEELESLKESIFIINLGSNVTGYILDQDLSFQRTGPNRFSITINFRVANDPGQ